MRIPFHFAASLFMSCAPARLLTPEALSPMPPRRLALAVAEPRQLLRVDGVDLAVHDSAPAGDKPVVLCLHAIGHGGGDFAGMEAALGAQFRVVTVDWPGHGASGQDREPASARRYATLARGVLEALGVNRAVLFGNSIGGAAALLLAVESPDRVRGVVACNPGGLDPGGLFAGLFIDSLVGRFRQGVAGEERFGAWFEAYYADILLTEAGRARREAIVAAGYESAPRLVEAWESFKTKEANLRARVQTITVPVFIGWAMRDGLVRWSRNADAVEAIPGVQVVKFERSGHAAFLEEPEAFQSAVRPFLERLP